MMMMAMKSESESERRKRIRGRSRETSECFGHEIHDDLRGFDAIL